MSLEEDRYDYLIRQLDLIESDLRYVKRFVGTSDVVGLSLALTYVNSTETAIVRLRRDIERECES